ncbi:hypothetical protein TNCV_968591 [Trichonephila clavipes]|nr:hypothetical protein TNCV_968591 [Trichonephila clavipes]
MLLGATEDVCDATMKDAVKEAVERKQILETFLWRLMEHGKRIFLHEWCCDILRVWTQEADGPTIERSQLYIVYRVTMASAVLADLTRAPQGQIQERADQERV